MKVNLNGWIARSSPAMTIGGERSAVLRGSHQGGNHEPEQQQADDRIFERVVDVLVPRLHALAEQAYVIDVAEILLNTPTRSPASFSVALSLMMWRLTQRFAACVARVRSPLDIAEQDARLVGGVLGVVDIGLVEQRILAVAPRIGNAVDHDAAPAGVSRRHQAEVVAQRSGDGVAMLHQRTPGATVANIAPLIHGIDSRSATVRGHMRCAESSASSYRLR